MIRRHSSYDSFGQVQSEQFFSSTGSVMAATDPAAIDTLFGYTGRAYDDATGLQNNLHRWYDAGVGRWASEDPIGFAAGDANLYRYVGNGSTGATDPSGLEKQADPKYSEDRREIQRICRRYAELYSRDPDKYLWTGLATHAGSQVISEIYDRLQREKISAIDKAVCLRIAAPASLIAHEQIQVSRIKAALMIQMQGIILQMAKDIEADIGRQFEAYDSMAWRE